MLISAEEREERIGVIAVRFIYNFLEAKGQSIRTKQAGLCISIFMPTYRTGVEIQQNQIRFRNLIRNTEDKLLARNLRPQEIKTILEPAQALAGNALFWKRQSAGLAIFMSAGLFRSYCLP
ncbi:MAG: hypothetical protein Q7I93_00645, partial [Syntrophales bacterium]|nr:hypothetical protein [Syntrophales bacterium]